MHASSGSLFLYPSPMIDLLLVHRAYDAETSTIQAQGWICIHEKEEGYALIRVYFWCRSKVRLSEKTGAARACAIQLPSE